MATTSAADFAELFTSDAAYADDAGWHASVSTLRREHPVYRVVQPGWEPVWAITRHADIVSIERKHAVFQNTHRVMYMPEATYDALASAGIRQNTLVHMDDPHHKKYRGLTIEHFTAGALRRRMEEQLRRLATETVDRMTELGGRCDFAADIAKFYPLQVILTLLGVPEPDHPSILRMAEKFFGPNDPEFGGAEGRSASYADAVGELRAYLGTLTSARRAEPTGDLASVIANSTVDGAPIGDREAVNYYSIMATAGHDTTSATLAGGLEVLLRHPDALADLQADPSLVKNAVEEILRWTSPVKAFTRLATEDVEVQGNTIAAGERVLLSFPSANRDEEVFDDPFTFDIRRPNANRNIAFGFGKHHCLGAELARMELRILFTELLSRLDTIELDGEVSRLHGTTVSGVKHLPVRYTWRR